MIFSKTRRQYYIASPKVKYLKREFGNKYFRLLDIGVGNHSATETKKILPNCEYHGVDKEENYSNSQEDFALMTKFYKLDLSELEYHSIPDDSFDAIIMNHVIEHLLNGDKVIEGLLPKLKVGGIIYVEYPRFKSTTLPSMKETLNFFDDQSHVRIYTLIEIYNLLLKNGCIPIKGGVRRDWVKIIFLPYTICYQYLSKGYLCGSLFWDLLGFSDFVFARKVKKQC